MIETSDGITTPSDNDPYKLVQDLGAMAETIQQVVNLRANLYKGTSSQRTLFTPDAEEGVFWKDTNGSKILWERKGTGWSQVFPEDRSSGVFQIGSATEAVPSPGQLQISRYYSSTNSQSRTNFVQSATQSSGLLIENRKDGSQISSLRIKHNGQLDVATHGAATRVRPIPFAFDEGTVEIPGGAGTITSAAVTFSPGRFTKTPHIFLQARSSAIAGMSAETGISGQSASGFTANLLRSNSTTSVLSWFAVQGSA